MPYCTKQQLINAFGELEIIERTDRGNIGSIDDVVLVAAQNRADSDIDRYLRAKGIAVDGGIISEDLKNIALDCTRFYLYDVSVPDKVDKAYQRQIKVLQDFVRGVVVFDFQESLGNPVQSSADVAFIGGISLFKDALERF